MLKGITLRRIRGAGGGDGKSAAPLDRVGEAGWGA